MGAKRVALLDPWVTAFDHRPPLDLPRPQPTIGFALGFFLVLGALSIVIGAPAQLAGIGPGLVFTEVFVFLAPSILLAHSLGIPARALVRAGAVPWRLVALGGAIGLLNYPLAIALEAAMRNVMPNLAQRFDIGGVLGQVTGASRAVLVLGVGFMAPLGEETAFRGVIQRLLRPRLNDAGTVLFTAVLFAAIHFDPVGFVGRVELGALFGVMALWSGSLWVGLAAHAANNLIAMAIFYGAGGRSDAELPGAMQLVGLAALGIVLTAPLLVLLRRWTRGCESPIELPEIHPSPIRGEVARWCAAMALAFMALAAVDRRGFHLSLTDATTPYVQGLPEGAKHAALDEQLHALRADANSGEVSTEAYDAFRRWLFRAAQDKSLEVPEIERRIRELRTDAKP